MVSRGGLVSRDNSGARSVTRQCTEHQITTASRHKRSVSSSSKRDFIIPSTHPSPPVMNPARSVMQVTNAIVHHKRPTDQPFKRPHILHIKGPSIRKKEEKRKNFP